MERSLIDDGKKSLDGSFIGGRIEDNEDRIKREINSESLMEAEEYFSEKIHTTEEASHLYTMALVAEQAGRYEDMKTFLKALIELRKIAPLKEINMSINSTEPSIKFNLDSNERMMISIALT